LAKLVRCELFKAFRQKKPYLFMLILTAAEIAAVVQHRRGGADGAVAEANGQSFPFLLLDGSAIFFPIFIALLAADSIADEYRSGTLKQTLLCPIGRIALLNAKVASLAVLIAALLVYAIVSSYAVGTLAFGWGDRTVVRGNVFATLDGIGLAAQTLLLSWLPCLAFGLFVLFAAMLTMNAGAAVGTALGLTVLSHMVEGVPGIRDILLTHQMRAFPRLAAGGAAIPDAWAGLGVIAVYIGAFYAGSAIILKKKDILN